MQNNSFKAAFPAVPQGFHKSVCGALDNLQEKEEKAMNKKVTFKRVLVAVAIAAVLSTGAFAAVVGSSWTSAHNVKGFDTLPTPQQIEKEIGVSAHLPQSFSNGYAYAGSTTNAHEVRDADGNKTASYMSLGAQYKSGVDTVFLDVMEEIHEESESLQPQYTANAGDIKIEGYEYINRIVPPDYEMTEQDKADEAAGKISFASNGSTQTSDTQIRFITWQQNGATYSMLTMDSPLTYDDLAGTAKEIMEQ